MFLNAAEGTKWRPLFTSSMSLSPTTGKMAWFMCARFIFSHFIEWIVLAILLSQIGLYVILFVSCVIYRLSLFSFTIIFSHLFFAITHILSQIRLLLCVSYKMLHTVMNAGGPVFLAYQIRISTNYTGASKSYLTDPYPSQGKDKNWEFSHVWYTLVA